MEASLTTSRFLLGVPLLLAVILPIAMAGFAARRRWLGQLSGPVIVVADVVVTLSIVTVTTQVLGTFGWFRLGPLIALHLVVGGGGWWLLGAPRPHRPKVTSSDRDGFGPMSGVARAGLVLTGVGVLATVGSWVARTLGALLNGISTVDSHWYHLPLAARFVQTGWLDEVHPFDGDPVTAYFPATSSVFHAVGFMSFQSDLLSTVINLGWFALLVLAAGASDGTTGWRLWRRRRRC